MSRAPATPCGAARGLGPGVRAARAVPGFACWRLAGASRGSGSRVSAHARAAAVLRLRVRPGPVPRRRLAGSTSACTFRRHAGCWRRSPRSLLLRLPRALSGRGRRAARRVRAARLACVLAVPAPAGRSANGCAAWLFTGFPWLTLGSSQVPSSPLAGYAPIVGVYGVSLAMAVLAGGNCRRGVAPGPVALEADRRRLAALVLAGAGSR